MPDTDRNSWAVPFDAPSGFDGSDEGSAEHFKWGWNAVTDEATVWRVTGGPDGQPFHGEHLTEAWGRPPSATAGDLMGVAIAQGGDAALDCYYGGPVPRSVMLWFAATFPSHRVRSG